MLLQIERVDVTKPPVKKTSTRPDGSVSEYAIYEWQVSGWLDGEYTGQLVVQTLSGKEADYVQAGWAGQVNIDTKFAVHYKIPTPPQGQQSQGAQQGLPQITNSQQAQAPQQGAPPAPGAPPPAPGQPAPQPQRGAPPVQGKVKFMDIVDGYTTCLRAAKHVLGSEGYSTGPEALIDIHAIAATLFIQAQRGGVHIPAPKQEQEAPPAPQQAPPPPPTPEPERQPEPPAETPEDADDPDNSLPF